MQMLWTVFRRVTSLADGALTTPLRFPSDAKSKRVAKRQQWRDAFSALADQGASGAVKVGIDQRCGGAFEGAVGRDSVSNH